MISCENNPGGRVKLLTRASESFSRRSVALDRNNTLEAFLPYAFDSIDDPRGNLLQGKAFQCGVVVSLAVSNIPYMYWFVRLPSVPRPGHVDGA
jgi:hypothetical protein